MLYNLQGRIDSAGVLHPDEVAAGVEAVLAGASDGSARLNAAVDPAVTRYGALDEEEQTAFRDALAAYVRAYAFLGQVVPFSDPALERSTTTTASTCSRSSPARTTAARWTCPVPWC